MTPRCFFGSFGEVEIAPDRAAFARLYRSGALVPVLAEAHADTETPISAALKLLAKEPHAFLFESVEGGERLGRYSFLGIRPREVLRWSLGQPGDPLAILQQRLAKRAPASALPNLPRFSGGWVGMLSYDAVRLFEPRVPASRQELLGFPDALFMEFDTVVAFDNVRRTTSVVAEVDPAEGGSADQAYRKALRRIQETFERLGRKLPPRRAAKSKGRITLRPVQSRASFEEAVARAREYICAGDCQQIVLSQRFEAEAKVDAFEIYRALRRINPSPYLFFLRLKDHAVIGSSPEALVRVDRGEVILRPLAGTRPRGDSPEADARLEAELKADPKERAEHVMLVDLGRNDVGRVAEAGSVRVEELMTVERYSHVMHLVSQIRGRLAPGKGPLDVLRATFPAGTVTGAPKVRAMEIIDQLEPVRRGPYAGCVGYLDRRGNLEMAIAIRTLMQAKGKLVAQAGAGVVYDSTPQAEYQETLNKARAAFSAVESVLGAKRRGGR